MRDDDTPTRPQPVDVLAAQLGAFREDPAQPDLFMELHGALRRSGQAEMLAELCELRAPHERDSMRAAALWSEAGEARLVLGHQEAGEKALKAGLALDPANERAAARLTERLQVAGRWADAASVLEAEVEALAVRAEKLAAEGPPGRRTEPLAGRRAQRHRALAQLWDERLGRVDRALFHWQRAWQLEPGRSEAIEAARALYASLGDDKMVARLYEAELDALGEVAPAVRRATLALELGRLLFRLGDPAGAAGRLEDALRLDPGRVAARETLAEVYASPHFSTNTGELRRAGELFVDLGKQKLADDDEDGAIGFLRRALGVDPYSRSGTDGLEEALVLAERWEELDRFYRHRESISEDAGEVAGLLRKRALLYEEQLADRDALKEVLGELVAREPPGGASSAKLREILRADQDWAKLAALIEREVEGLRDDPDGMCRELLELATIEREHRGDRDHAAERLHKVLSIDPRNEEALARYGDHFRERRDWRGLADLTEYAIDNAREAGASPGELSRQLEELAQICEMRLGDLERATAAWRKILEIEPHSAKAAEALRRLASRGRMWESLVGVLEQESAAARGPQERADALRRMAQVYRERQVNPRKAIELYEEVLGLAPGDPGSLKALVELYEREGDDPGVARTLRRQLDTDAQRVQVELAALGPVPATPREWPVAQRVERLTVLRRLAAMYEQRLADVEGVVFAASGILEILPGDRDALERMERVLDKAGDVERLEQTLEYHAAAAGGPAERARVLRRLAKLAAERGDDVRALERWEQTLKAAPNEPEALAALAALYERFGRWPDLAAVLERSLLAGKPPPPGSSAAAKRALDLKRYAQVVDGKLSDAARSTRAWRHVLEALPRDREALAALARLHAARGEWRELADVLDRQAPLHAADDPAAGVQVALQRAQLLEDRLGAPAEAARALEALLRDLDPANLEAHRSLRRLYEARGDFDAAVRIAEREMYLADERHQKIARGLEIGLLCRDRLGDPVRALQAFERVLELAPDHDETLAATAELYAQVGDWRRHLDVLEQRINRTPAGRERRALLLRIAQVTAERLGDPTGAFGWYRRAHEHAPDATTLGELRRAAETYGLWVQLAEVYEQARGGQGGRPADPEAYVSASRELAAIAERHLADPARALKALRDAVAAAPRDERLIAEAERIAGDADERPLWGLLLECLAVALPALDRPARVALHLRRARVLEERIAEPAAAMQELLRAFAWVPEREETRAAISALAARAGRWQDAVAVEAALYERASSVTERVSVLRRKAAIVEEHLHERARAFRLHLSAFLLVPDAPEVTADLWRLGRLIGRYREADRSPRPEPAPAHVEPAEAAAALVIKSGKPARADATQELTDGDILIEGATARPDATIQLDLQDVITIADRERPDPTIELKTEELIQVLGNRSAAPPPPPPLPGVTPPPGSRKGPPPPPPRLPEIRRQPAAAPAAPQRPAAPPVRPPHADTAVRAAAPPTLPPRPYASPWEELATAYEALPAPDAPTRLRWLFRAAEVWETGAEDLGKAFDTLSRALAWAADDVEPRARLHRLAADHGAWDRLAELYEGAAEGARTSAAAASLLVEVAEIRRHQERPHETESLYRRILGMRPDDAAVREKLEALYREGSRWIDLAAALEERTDPRLGTAAPEQERPALLRELAAVYDQKLGRPLDALEALERLRLLIPEDLDILEQMAELCSRVGRWSKVIEVLNRLREVGEPGGRGRDALRRIGEIYEAELELPDRAIEAFSQLVAVWPDDAAAHAALDRLYESLGRWADLGETLRRRAALAEEPPERATLLRRRAKVLLDWLGAPEEAAAALRHARAVDPTNPELAEELVHALVKAGRAREAAAVLEARAEQLAKADAAAGDVAAVLLRLASLRAEQLADPIGARRALDEALALVPDHPTALAALARIAEATADPRGYAEAKLREAHAVQDVDARVAALLEAGATLRDACQDREGARAAFEEVVTLQPANADATWALAGLVAMDGDLDSAATLLERRLAQETLGAEERARLLTQLAALARRAGVDAAALRRLDDALTAMPDHVPAVIARADLLEALGRYEELEIFLRAVVPRLGNAPSEVRAELDRLLALAFEKLGRDDAAYQALLEADKLHRGHLLIRLALGENRYRAKRWREAALHLAALATHPDAARHAAEVAEGLYHAALAEIRSLRPERAEALYVRALELKGNYAPALHALAEIAMERNEHGRAADLLTRQATATEDAGERMRLFEALGDMALITLHDESRARVCFEAALAAADPLESKHLPLLEKLLERQDLAGDHLGAARTAELMASFGANAQAQAARYTAAAESYVAGGDVTRARGAAERAVEADPYDLAALTVLTDLLLAAGQHDDAAAVLGRALSGRAPADEVTALRQAELWRRLAEARRSRGDARGSIAAFERALAAAPEADAGMAARRALLALRGDEAGRADEAIEHLRALARAERKPADVLALAHRHQARMRRPDDIDAYRVCLEVADALGAPLGEEERAFLAGNPPPALAPDEQYRGALPTDERIALVADDEDAPLAEIMITLWEAAPLLWSQAEDALERAYVAGAQRVPATSPHAAVAMFAPIAKALGAPASSVYATAAERAPDVQVLCVSPPLVVLGPRMLAAPPELSPAQARFLLGRAAELARPERVIATGLARGDLAGLLGSLRRALGLPGAADLPLTDEVKKQDEALRRTLPVKLRTTLEGLLRAAGRIDLDRYVAACQRAADRAGLLVCGDLGVALALAGGAERGGHLIDLALRMEYLAARRQLGLAVG